MDLRMPKLATPFPVTANQHIDTISDHTREWVQKWDLLTKPGQTVRYFDHLMCHVATAVTNPTLGRAELCLMNDWIMWLFLQDDFWGCYPDSEEGAASALDLLPELVTTMAGTDPRPSAHEHGLAASFADLWNRTTALASPDQAGRLRESFYQTHLSIFWEGQVARDRHPINLVQYRSMRVAGAAAISTLQVEEILGDYAIPLPQIHDPRVKRLVWLSAAITCWLNDVVSYPKETCTEQSNAFSIPEILRGQHGYTPQQALDAAAEVFYQSIRDYQCQEAEVLTFADPELRRYIEEALRPFISGWTNWCYRTGRYGLGMSMDAAPLPLTAENQPPRDDAEAGDPGAPPLPAR